MRAAPARRGPIMTKKILKCEEVREIVLSRELGFEVERERQVLLERHLAECEACRAMLLEEEEITLSLEEGVRQGRADLDLLAERISNSLPAFVVPSPGFFSSKWIQAAAAAVFFILGVFAGTVFRGKPDGPEGGGSSRISEVAPAPRAAIPHEVLVRGNYMQRVLPDNRIVTEGRRRFLFEDPSFPGFKAVLDCESRLEDPKPVMAVDIR